jgi:hypothetical protein
MNFMQAQGTGFLGCDVAETDHAFPQRESLSGHRSANDQPAGRTRAAGTHVFLDSPVGAIYYTTDGSDPRGANGQPSATAQQYQGGSTQSDLVAKNSMWRYLVTPSAAPSTWKQILFNDSGLGTGPGATRLR